MPKTRFNKTIGLLLLLSAIVGAVLISSTNIAEPSNRATPLSSQTPQISPTAQTTAQASSTVLATPTVGPIETFSPPPADITWLPTTPGIPTWAVILTPNPTDVASSQRAQYELELLYERPGTIIAQGINTTPIPAPLPNAQLLSYSVEEVLFPGPVEFTLGPLAPITVDRIWRLTVSGEHLITGNIPMVLWLDDHSLGTAAESDGTKLLSIVFDVALLREGAQIGVSYDNNPQSRVFLPETLHVSPGP